MLGGNIDLNFHATDNASSQPVFSFQGYFQKRCDTAIYDQATGVTDYYPHDAGMSLLYQTFGPGMNYAF